MPHFPQIEPVLLLLCCLADIQGCLHHKSPEMERA